MGEIDLGAAAEATIQAYKELATDPSKRLALALDRTCVQFLAYVVAEGEGSLVQSAIETLSLIAESKDCRPSLANTFGVLESLQSITEDEEIYTQDLRDQAAGLFTCLQFARHMNKYKSTETPSLDTKPDQTPSRPDAVDSSAGREDEEEESSSKAREVMGSSSSRADGSKRVDSGVTEEPKELSKGDIKPQSSTQKKDSKLGQLSSKAKIITLFIKGMVNPEHRKLVEEELVRVRGLISIVFDLSHSRVTCRVKRDLSVEKLAAAIARTEVLSAQQVTTNVNGEEEIVPLGRTPSDTTSSIEDLPDYLPEEETPVKDIDSAMAPSGSFMETASTWISTASNFLQNSFYW